MTTAGVELDQQTSPPATSTEDLAKSPIDAIDISKGDRYNLHQDSLKRKVDSTGNTANGHVSKKARLDDELDEETSINCAIPQPQVCKPNRGMRDYWLTFAG